jgi:hypothetical protein
MKKILNVIIVLTILLTIQVLPSFAANTSFPSTLTAEDEKRLMDYRIPVGPYSVTSMN